MAKKPTHLSHPIAINVYNNVSKMDRYTSIGAMFLVPAHLQTKLESLVRRRTFAQAFRSLLRNYVESTIHCRGVRVTSVNRAYQSEGLKLKRIGVKVREVDLIEFGVIATYLGVSKCWLFSYMLEMDEIGWGEVLGEMGMVRPLALLPRLKLTLTTKPSWPGSFFRIRLVYRL